MSKNIELPEELIKKAEQSAKSKNISVAEQIETWATIGKAAEDNPDLPVSFIAEILEAKKETEFTEYEFSKD